MDLIEKGEDYKDLKKSFVIFICTYDPFKAGRHIYTFENDYSAERGAQKLNISNEEFEAKYQNWLKESNVK